MVDYNFYGRPDGIGNRLEQIILLEAYSLKKNMKINYIWENKYAYRSYDIFLSADRVSILKNAPASKELELNVDPEKQNQHFQNLTQREVLAAAKKIEPAFDIFFENDIKPVGIHLRGTDRIGKNHDHFMKDYEEFNLYIAKTINLINTLKPKHIFICSDQSSYKRVLRKKLNKSIKIIDPICSKEVPGEYVDFFALSLCQSIYMSSKYSTFAITASMIGNIPLISYTRNETIAVRHKALFTYDTDFGGLSNKQYVKEYKPSLWAQLILKLRRAKKKTLKFINK
ncbi:hypothetical protein SAMN05192588_0282 [Nonlabens sp. Hel1_33_55]|uniref:hypothetical protein n=1 Tax=Nonlabens sp. Hel1_33_55 TaxID=1336802 RepID=UPI000875E068|nr:hypothetical protein [Nonlabens sp. Hel1_33_55]SCX92361.1 hypothetical protein SAMN05192588_0282 [Nonlabens sp. Hel1_33_55]